MSSIKRKGLSFLVALCIAVTSLAGVSLSAAGDSPEAQFKPGVGGDLPSFTPFEEEPNQIGMLFVETNQRWPDLFEGTYAQVDLSFDAPKQYGATSYNLECSSDGENWSNFLLGGAPVVTSSDSADNFSLEYDSHTFFRLKVNGGKHSGWTSNVVEVTPSEVDTYFSGWSFDESMSISGVMTPFVGCGKEASFTVKTIEVEPKEVSGSLTLQWYRVNPVTFEMTPISGANSGEYITTNDDIGYMIAVRAQGDEDSVGGFAQILGGEPVFLGNRAYVTDITRNGFRLNLYYNVPGLSGDDLRLTYYDGENEVEIPVTAASVGGDNAIYDVSATIPEDVDFLWLHAISHFWQLAGVEGPGGGHMMPVLTIDMTGGSSGEGETPLYARITSTDTDHVYNDGANVAFTISGFPAEMIGQTVRIAIGPAGPESSIGKAGLISGLTEGTDYYYLDAVVSSDGASGGKVDVSGTVNAGVDRACLWLRVYSEGGAEQISQAVVPPLDDGGTPEDDSDDKYLIVGLGRALGDMITSEPALTEIEDLYNVPTITFKGRLIDIPESAEDIFGEISFTNINLFKNSNELINLAAGMMFKAALPEELPSGVAAELTIGIDRDWCNNIGGNPASIAVTNIDKMFDTLPDGFGVDSFTVLTDAVQDPGVVTNMTYVNNTFSFDVSHFSNFVVQISAPGAPAKHVVNFVDWDGRILKSEAVEDGKGATPPADPDRTGYTFTGWAPELFDDVTDDLVVTAQYSTNMTKESGRLLKPTGAPVVNWPVYLYHVAGLDNDVFVEMATTDADGKFALYTLSNEQYVLRSLAYDDTVKDLEELFLSGSGSKDFQFAANDAEKSDGKITVTVKDDLGAPVSAAEVSYWSDHNWQWGYASTGADGKAVFENLKYPNGGTATFYMYAYKGMIYKSATVVLGAPNEADLTITFPAQMTISGRVTYAAGGAPAQYMGVHAYADDWSGGYGWTDADGKYSITVEKGKAYTVEADQWGQYIAETPITGVTADKTDADIVLVQPPGLRGTIINTMSAKYTKAQVSLEKSDGAGWTYVASTYAAGDGAFRFDKIPSTGTYRISIVYMQNDWRSVEYTSTPVQFTVTSLAAGDVSKEISFSVPVNYNDAFKGAGNAVAADVTTTQPGKQFNVAVKYKNNLDVTVNSAEFEAVLPTGVTKSGGNLLKTETNMPAGAQGKFEFSVLVDRSYTQSVVSIPVTVKVSGVKYDFGVASVEVVAATINGPATGKANESFKVYGDAPEGSQVKIVDLTNAKILATSNLNGRWYSASIALPQAGSYRLVAQAVNEASGSVIAQSDPLTVEVSDDPLALVDIRLNSQDSAQLPPNKFTGVRNLSAWVDSMMNGRDILAEIKLNKDATSVKYQFSGKEFTAQKQVDGFWKANITGWKGAGLKKLDAVVVYNAKTYVIPIAEVTVLVDPSGYVYDVNTAAPLQGVEVTCEIKDGGVWQKWDAAAYGQDNPQTTDSEGKYGWMVPAGEYRVIGRKAGYEEYVTEKDDNVVTNKSIVIPPPRTDVNLGMYSTADMGYTKVTSDQGNITIEFNKQIDATDVASKVVVKDSLNATVAGGTVEVSGRNLVYTNAAMSSGSYTVKVTGLSEKFASQAGTKKTFTGDIAVADYKDGKIAVTSVTLDKIGANVKVGESVALTATVLPANATDKSVTFSSDKTAVAEVSGAGVVTAKAEGTATITARTVNGLTAQCAVLVEAAPLPALAGTPTITGTLQSGQQLTAGAGTLNPATGITFKWYRSSDKTFDAGTDTLLGVGGTYTAVQDDVGRYIIVTATSTDATGSRSVASTSAISAVGGGGGSGTVTTTTTPGSATSTKGDTTTLTASVEATATGGAGAASASIASSVMTDMVSKAKQAEADGRKAIVEVNVTSPAGATSVRTEIARQAFNDVASTTQADVRVGTPLGTITFDAKAVESISGAADSGNVSIGMGKVDVATLGADVREKVGDRPVYDFSVKAGATGISSFGGGKAEISVPYTLKAGEEASSVIVYYIGDDGSLKTVRGRYVAETGTVDFTVTHFSKYAVGYSKVAFVDVPAGSWYEGAVDFIAARGITTGTGGGNYSPNATLTRGQYVVMMLRAYGFEPIQNPSDNFADAGNTYYTGYLATAKKLGISAGVGDNKYAPERAITRQEMFTLLYNALKAIDELPEGAAGKPLSAFGDSASIAPWARAAMSLFAETGTVRGSDGMLLPAETSTRAQMAQVLFNLLSK